MHTAQQRGFTLVELSIVLVILGLLIGGVLTGQSLIRAAEVGSVATQYTRYMTASQTFRDKYMALPGDMPNAQAYWGVQHATAATCKTTASTTALTCNGDGDGRLSPDATGSNEVFRYWQHLANAGLIEGTYDGITHGSSSTSTTFENAPAGRISGTLWSIQYWGAMSGAIAVFDGQYDNSYLYGVPFPNATPAAGALRPEEAYNIDVKVDDGKPAMGKVVVLSTLGACHDGATTAAITANYKLTNTAIACGLFFRQQF